MAELTGLNTCEGWPGGTWMITRRARPSGRQTAQPTGFEKKTGRR